MKRFVVAALLGLLIALAAAAVKYKILSHENQTAAAWITAEFSDEKRVEPTVEINGKIYTVTTMIQDPEYVDDGWPVGNVAYRIYIPATVKYLRAKAFYDHGANELIFEDDKPFEEVGDSTFGNNYMIGARPPYKFNLDLLPVDPRKLGKGIFVHTTTGGYTGGSQLTEIPDFMFYCNWLKKIDWPFNPTKIGVAAFSSCKLCQDISLGDKVEIGNFAFYINQLTGLTLGANVVVGRDAFSYNSEMKFINMGNGCTLGDRAFGPNKTIKELTIPSGTTLGSTVFHTFLALEKVHIGEDVVFTGEKCFFTNKYVWSLPAKDEYWEMEPKPLTVYYYTASPQFTEADQFEDLTYEEGCLYVYPEGVEAARSTYPWSRFKTILPMDPAVGIKDIETEASITDDSTEEVYTLGGVRVGTSTEGLSPGIYVVRQGAESRKVVVR